MRGMKEKKGIEFSSAREAEIELRSPGDEIGVAPARYPVGWGTALKFPFLDDGERVGF